MGGRGSCRAKCGARKGLSRSFALAAGVLKPVLLKYLVGLSHFLSLKFARE
jgi:hypothetical protein